LEPVREKPKTPEPPPAIEPELVTDEYGRIVKRYPPRWAVEEGQYTAKPKGKPRRKD
jgi:hypothetical protein